MDMSEIKLKNIVVVEGFEMVGKTTFINNELSHFVNYHATHDLTDKTIGRDNSWTIGYGVFDLLSQIETQANDPTKSIIYPHLAVVIDRGVFSSYVYQKLYGSGELSSEVIEYYKNNKFFHDEVSHLYVVPKNATVARQIYEKSASRPENPNALSNKYDQFDSFESYWSAFLKADKLFEEAYQIMNVSPHLVVNTGSEYFIP